MINTLTLAMPFVSQFRVLTHARENGLSYCALAHAAECKHSFGAVLKRTSMKRTLCGIFTHSVRSTPLTTISTATLWLNH